jgi:hypothetical protein
LPERQAFAVEAVQWMTAMGYIAQNLLAPVSRLVWLQRVLRL